MYLKNQLGKNIAAVLLLLALILPTAIQFSHMVEGHEDVTCNDQSTHIHKSSKKLAKYVRFISHLSVMILLHILIYRYYKFL